MMFIVFKSVRSLLTTITLILCLISTTAAESGAAVSPVLGCKLDNDTYICTGAQYHMYCNTTMHRFSYQRYQNQNQYKCLSNYCLCVGNKDTCTCYSSTFSPCFCENYGNNNTIPTAVRPIYNCGLYNDTYICTGAQYRMYCNTKMHDFKYQRYGYQNQYQYECMSNNCDCIGNKDTCTCYSSTLSSCFCESYSYNISILASVSLIYNCVLHNDTYICTGAQYRMYCNTSEHYFYYKKYGYQNQYEYQCWSYNCDCIGNEDSCTCYSSTLSSCLCETYSNNITIPTAHSPATVPDCVLYNDTYICTGAQYRMYCNTTMHHFSYQRYRYQNSYQFHCWSNNCYCIGNKDTCTCYSSTLFSCFCESYNNNITIPTAHSPATVPDCVLYNDTYICTGAQYRMYCNTRMHDFDYHRYGYQNQDQYRCMSNTCYCVGNNDTCTCYSSTLSSCFCETYGDIIAITTAVTPVYDCVLYNDTYICTGAQYRMYCNKRMHHFNYQRYGYQNSYQFHCWSNNCNCIGNEDTCTCYSSTLSSCFCESYSNSFTILKEVSPVYDCVLYNDTYICTGAQYRMYCNTRMHDFYYQRYQNQDQYQCWSNYCDCFGNKDTCTCYSSILSSCFCETYGNIIALTTAVTPVFDCVLYNDTYICTGAQYCMYCNTSEHYFYYDRHMHHCTNNNCYCIGNKDTCTCSSSTSSSCFCTNYSSSFTIPTATLYHMKYVLRKLFCKSQLRYMPTYKQCYYVGP